MYIPVPRSQYIFMLIRLKKSIGMILFSKTSPYIATKLNSAYQVLMMIKWNWGYWGRSRGEYLSKKLKQTVLIHSWEEDLDINIVNIDDNDFSEEDPDLIAGTGLVVVTHNRAKRFHLYSLVKCNSVWRNRESPFDRIVLLSQFHSIPELGKSVWWNCTLKSDSIQWKFNALYYVGQIYGTCVVQIDLMESGDPKLETCQKCKLEHASLAYSSCEF